MLMWIWKLCEWNGLSLMDPHRDLDSHFIHQFQIKLLQGCETKEYFVRAEK